MFWKIATSALLALTWSLPAFATHRDRREARDNVRIERLAHELEESAVHVSRQIHGSRHSRHGHHNRYERRASRAVHELKDAAKHFHQGVEHNRNSSFHLSRDFDRVAHAYETAVYQIERAHLSRHVRRDLRRVGRWIERISDRRQSSSRHAKSDGHARFTRHDRYTRDAGNQRYPSRGFWSVSWKSPRRHYQH